MADFKDKFSGKEFKETKNILELFNDAIAKGGVPVIDGRLHEKLPEKEAIGLLPFRIKEGDQAKFFPGLKDGTSDGGILTGSIVRDTVRKIQYVPLKKSSFQNNIIGPNSFISNSFSTGAFLQISAAFAAQFNGIDPNTTIQYLVEENYSASGAGGAGAVAPFVGVVDFKTADGLTSSFSGIHGTRAGHGVSEKGVELLLDLRGSTSVTHAQIRMAKGLESVDLKQNVLLVTSSLLFQNSGTLSQSFATGLENNFPPLATFITGSDTTFTQPAASGSPSFSGSGDVALGRGVEVNINRLNDSDGTYLKYFVKGKIAGDSDSGSLYEFFEFGPNNANGTPQNGVEIVIYPEGSVVTSSLFRFIHHSGSTKFTGTQHVNANGSSFNIQGFERSVTASVITKKLFYISSSTTPGFNGLFTGSDGGDGLPYRIGSLLHEDVELKTPAVNGLYSIFGNDTVSFVVGTSSRGNDGAALSTHAMKVPRILSASKLS